MVPERSSQSYGPGVTSASKAVLLELMTVLRAYQDALVLVGGWVPSLLLERHQRPTDAFSHVGSIDIDLAVDPSAVEPGHYATIVQLLGDRGYRPAKDRRQLPLPESFERTVLSPMTNKSYTIRVDFLSPRHREASAGRHVSVQEDLMARKVYGCDAAFRHQTTVPLTGRLPDGGELTVPIRVADVVGCVAMKGIVLGERYREKDAYDLYALIAHYAGGPRDVAALVRPHLADPSVAEGLEAIRTAFQRREANGPAWVASFLLNPMFAREYERLRTDAFMMVDEFNRLVREPAPAAS